MALRVGVILSGCGFLDGSEIHEAVSILIALDRRGAAVTIMAPATVQTSSINHLNRQPHAHLRNVLEESARIARGKVVDIATVRSADLDALVLPGGYGAAKNLSTFAMDGPECRVNEHVARLIEEMHAAKKPIGLACIAPVLAAQVLGRKGHHPILTIGTEPNTAEAMQKMGATHRGTAPADICIDPANRLVTTPCYMNDVGPWTIYQGADKMVEEVLKMAKPNPT